MFPVPSSRPNAREAFSKAVIRRIVDAVENGIYRKELRSQHGMASATLDFCMTQYGSIKYHQNKKKSFSETERNLSARAVLEGRISVKEAVLSKGGRVITIQKWVKQKQGKEADISTINQQVMSQKTRLPTRL